MKHFFTLLGLFLTLSSFGQDTLRTFIFGHSLINHEHQVNITPSQETSVPHWFHYLAQEAGRRYEVGGQYGFLPQHGNVPPISQWGFDVVPGAWESDTEPFSDAGFHNIMITPGNFIQWQGPDENYFNDTQSPLDYTRTVFDWTLSQEPDIDLFIYENWPDMGGYLNNGFPPTQQEWVSYNNYLEGDFHDWNLEYFDSLSTSYPDVCLRMIPVGPILSKLLFTAPFDQIPVDTLYEDDAPHGRPTIYFLAALVTYMTMYEEVAPTSYTPPLEFIDERVVNNYATVVDFIWNELLAFEAVHPGMVFCEPPVVLSTPTSSTETYPIYPNPASNSLTLPPGAMVHSVVNTMGQPMELSVHDSIVDIELLSPGIYFLQWKLDTDAKIRVSSFRKM